MFVVQGDEYRGEDATRKEDLCMTLNHHPYVDLTTIADVERKHVCPTCGAVLLSPLDNGLGLEEPTIVRR